MAATRLIALHVNKGKSLLKTLAERTDYAKNPEKTEKGELVTGYECDPMTVDEEFYLSKKKYDQVSGRRSHNDVIAYQIRQSFKPGEVTPEEANAIGRELALRFTKGDFAFIVATHTDRAHIHNHIIFNSTSIDGTHKFRDFKRSGMALQRVSDIICLEHGLSVITPKPYGQRTKRPIYGSGGREKQRTSAALQGINRNVNLILDIQEKLKTRGAGYAQWATVYNLQQMAKSLLFLRDHNIQSLADLEEISKKQTQKRDELLEKVKAYEQRLAEISELRRHIITYVKTKDVYAAYRKAGYSKAFYEAHREEIALHKAAKEAFDRLPSRKIPKVRELNDEFQKVLSDKRSAYNEYKKEKDRAKEVLIVKQNICSLYTANGENVEQNREKEMQH